MNVPDALLTLLSYVCPRRLPPALPARASAFARTGVRLLLTLLIRLVQDIDRGVEGVVETLGQTARNTGESFLIADTAGQVDAVLAEGLNHHLFLTRVLSGSGKKAVPR